MERPADSPARSPEPDIERLHEAVRQRPHRADGWYRLATAIQEANPERTPAQRRLVIDALARFLDLAPQKDRRRRDALDRFTDELKQEGRNRYESGDLRAPVT